MVLIKQSLQDQSYLVLIYLCLVLPDHLLLSLLVYLFQYRLVSSSIVSSSIFRLTLSLPVSVNSSSIVSSSIGCLFQYCLFQYWPLLPVLSLPALSLPVSSCLFRSVVSSNIALVCLIASLFVMPCLDIFLE